jgi:hypothetical protein
MDDLIREHGQSEGGWLSRFMERNGTKESV